MFFLSFFLSIYLLIGCAGSSLLRELFSNCGEWRLLSSCGARAPHCSGFSCHRAQALECVGSAVLVPWALGHQLNGCCTPAWLPHSMWDLPGSGTEPVSPALAGRFCTTKPPGKPLSWVLILRVLTLGACLAFLVLAHPLGLGAGKTSLILLCLYWLFGWFAFFCISSPSAKILLS